MIKILFFIENLSAGGAEKVLQNLVNNMDKEKFDVNHGSIHELDLKNMKIRKIFFRQCPKTFSGKRCKIPILLLFFEFSRNNCYIFLKTHALLKKK